MTFQNQEFIFKSDALSSEELMIRELNGVEEISQPFRFELELLSTNPNIDLEAVLYAPAQLGIKMAVALGGGNMGKTTTWIAGRLDGFRLVRADGEGSLYHAVLVPGLCDLEEHYRSRIFMGDSAPEIVGKVLEESGLKRGEQVSFSESLEQALAAGNPTERAKYPAREYVVQYDESDLDFVHRWLEHEGIFYWFENTSETEEVLHLGDSVGSYRALRAANAFPYRPAAAEGAGQDSEMVVTALTCEVARQPKKVVLQDYNWRQPTQDLRVEQTVRDKSGGIQYEYNDHYKTIDQGKHLAQVRAEEWSCRARIYQGESDGRSMRPGFTFSLSEHPRDDFNGDLLLTRVVHHATQDISLDKNTITAVRYTNTFTAIPADVCYRPECNTAWPPINGVMHARVDGGSDGEYADLDQFGRYTVRVPFDQHGDDKDDGKASRQIRMLQPYAGQDSGMHFPLRKGTEVLLTHLDGDPDRPLIGGAVPDASTPSVVDQGNHTQNRIVSTSGNELTMEDESGREGITLIGGGGSTYSCYTKPGSMGQGGGGSGGGSGGAVRRRAAARAEPAARAGADAPAEAAARAGGGLPGGGDGSMFTEGDTQDLTTQSETGATEFLGLEGYPSSGPSSTALNAAYGKVYKANGANSSNAVSKLNADCSAFEAAVGKYELIVGGPHVEAKFGDIGEYLESTYNLSEQTCREYEERVNASSAGAGHYYEDVGWNTRFGEIRSRQYADTILDQVGPDIGDAFSQTWPVFVRSTVRGTVVMDELWAQAVVLHFLGAPLVFEVNGSVMTLNLNIGAVVIDIFFPAVDITLGMKSIEAHIFKDKLKLTDFEATVSANLTELNNNKATLMANSTWVTDNKAQVAENKLAIANNKTKISENEANISKNTSNIAKNGANLSLTKIGLNETITNLNTYAASLASTQSALVNKIGLP